MSLPDGPKPPLWSDMEFASIPKSYPSTWQKEIEQLRAENSRLIEELDRAMAWRDKDWGASQENTALITEVYRLRIAITHALSRLDASLFTNAEHAQAKDILGKALK